MNMVFAEFIIAAFGLPVDFTASFYHGWKMGKTLCHLTGFILTTTGKCINFFIILDLFIFSSKDIRNIYFILF